MKKILLAVSIAVGITIVGSSISQQHLEASAKSYDMSPTFAKALKNGTMPRLKGKVGMTYKILKQKEPKGHVFISDRFNFYELNNQSQSRDLYAFDPNDRISSSDKVTAILRSYNYLISSKSVEKYFGKPYKAIGYDGKVENSYVYKSKDSKYYILVFPDKRDNNTDVYVGKKAAILDTMLYQKIYR